MKTEPAFGVPLYYTSTRFRLLQGQGIGKAHLKMNQDLSQTNPTSFATSGPSVLEVSFELHAISFDLYRVHVALLQYHKHIPGLALDIFNTNTSYPKLKTTVADKITETQITKVRAGQICRHF